MQPAVVQHPLSLPLHGSQKGGLELPRHVPWECGKGLRALCVRVFVWSDFECSSDSRAARVLSTLVAEPTASSGKIRDATA